MARYMLMVMSGPTKGEGDEDTYNKWYDEVHVPDLLQVEGLNVARRFKVIQNKRADWPYVAAYEIETDDLAATLAEMNTKPRPFDPTYDKANSGHILAVEIGS